MFTVAELWGSGHAPLSDLPWRGDALTVIEIAKGLTESQRCMLFDMLLSLAYAEYAKDLMSKVQYCSHVPAPYSAQTGFINLCSACLIGAGQWTYQTAAKPPSGSIGKITSELVLAFIAGVSQHISGARAIGGTNPADFIIKHESKIVIVGEIKSSPMLTYPILFGGKRLQSAAIKDHDPVELPPSGFQKMDTALFLQNGDAIPLGKYLSDGWPFKEFVRQLPNVVESDVFRRAEATWENAYRAYSERDRTCVEYYLANASGRPPNEAVLDHGWPKKESISDSKTSAGLDRTDDIKKGVYQVLKLGTGLAECGLKNVKTALMSNIPAIRHHDDYVAPFVGMLWGSEDDLSTPTGEPLPNNSSFEQAADNATLSKSHLRRTFDYIIALRDSTMRDLEL